MKDYPFGYQSLIIICMLENSSKPQHSTVNGVFPSSNGTYLANKNIKHSKGVSDLYLGWNLSPSYRHFVNIIYNLKVQ